MSKLYLAILYVLAAMALYSWATSALAGAISRALA